MKRTLIFFLTLGLISSSQIGFVGELSAASAGLTISPVYMSDVSTCFSVPAVQFDSWVAKPWTASGIDKDTKDCPAANQYLRTWWAFSVRNTSKTKMAYNVSTRFTMFDASKNAIVNEIVPVAALILPGETVWVAPTMREDWFSTHPRDWKSFQYSGIGVSAQVSSLRAKWKSRSRTPKLPTVDLTLETSKSLTYSKYLRYTGSITLPKSVNGSLTFMFLKDDGTPAGGFRYRGLINKGATAIDYETQLPNLLAQQIGLVQIIVRY